MTVGVVSDQIPKNNKNRNKLKNELQLIPNNSRDIRGIETLNFPHVYHDITDLRLISAIFGLQNVRF